MADDSSRDDRERLLFYIGLAGAVLFIVTAALVVVAQTMAPIFGLQAGSPDPTVIGSMLVWAAIALGFLPAAALLQRRRNGDG